MPEDNAHGLENHALREQYVRAGFAGRVGWGTRPAVLVIDMAGAWLNTEEQLGSNLDDVLGGVLRVLDAARSTQLPILFTTMAYDPALTEISEVLRRKTPHCTQMIRGGANVALAPSLARRPDETLIEKPHASAFFGTNLISMLIARGIDTVVVVGCSTSGCIRSTCESAFNYDLHAIVPRQAVGDRSPTAHAAALFDIDARFGDVIDIEDAIVELSSADRLHATIPVQ